MRFIGQGRTRIVAAAAAILLAGGIGVAVAATSSAPPSNAVKAGRGIPQYGLTKGFLKGHTVEFKYNKGFYCDTKVKSAASSKCEAGAPAMKAPKGPRDPLFITVPLGFNVKPMNMECPNALACVDHPGTIDLTRLEPALKPLYPQLTDAQLTAALKNFATPGHQHFITTAAHSRQEWWDVKVVGVTNRAEYQKINQHKSASYLKKQIRAGKTTAAIPTNLFLFFGVR
jgi:hypothetical protein